jgi:hypothetical protein
MDTISILKLMDPYILVLSLKDRLKEMEYSFLLMGHTMKVCFDVTSLRGKVFTLQTIWFTKANLLKINFMEEG